MRARADRQNKSGARTTRSIIALTVSVLLNGNLAVLGAGAEAAKPALKPIDPSLAKLDATQKSSDLGTVKSSPVTTKGSKGGLVPPPPPTAYSYNPYGYPPPYPAYPTYPMPGYPMPPGYAMPGYAMPGYAMPPPGYAMPNPYAAPGYAPGMAMPMQQPMQQPMQVNVQPGMPPQQMQQPMQNMQMPGGMQMQGGMQQGMQMPQQGYGNSGYQGAAGRASLEARRTTADRTTLWRVRRTHRAISSRVQQTWAAILDRTRVVAHLVAAISRNRSCRNLAMVVTSAGNQRRRLKLRQTSIRQASEQLERKVHRFRPKT
jgi:hypothetical protein